MPNLSINQTFHLHLISVDLGISTLFLIFGPSFPDSEELYQYMPVSFCCLILLLQGPEPSALHCQY